MRRTDFEKDTIFVVAFDRIPKVLHGREYRLSKDSWFRPFNWLTSQIKNPIELLQKQQQEFDPFYREGLHTNISS